jgi:hypothetical protein
MTDHELIAEYIAKHGVTKCPPGRATGTKMNRMSRKEVNRQRREWRKAQEAKANHNS